MKKNIRSLSASCLCAGVSMSIRGEFRPVINCHCIQCTKTHGNYAAYTSVLEENILFKSKKSLQWFKSSKEASRGFCNICGSSIFFKRYGSRAVSVSAGLFRNPSRLKTVSHIYVKNKRDYYTITDNLPKFNKYK